MRPMARRHSMDEQLAAMGEHVRQIERSIEGLRLQIRKGLETTVPPQQECEVELPCASNDHLWEPGKLSWALPQGLWAFRRCLHCGKMDTNLFDEKAPLTTVRYWQCTGDG